MASVNLKCGDCLELMKDIPDGSIDLVLTDPPYGIINNTDLNWRNIKKNNLKIIKWDEILDVNKVFEEISRILRPNGKCLLFCQEPYTSKLILNAIPNLPFSYKCYWEKEHAGNILLCKKAVVNYIEEICLFTKQGFDYKGNNPLRKYFLEEKEKCKNADFKKILGNDMASHYFTKGFQFVFPTKDNYIKLQKTGNFNMKFEDIKKIDDEWKEKNKSVFNLWEGKKSKSNVFEYKKDNERFHPTQKPVLLLEDLIKTFSNENDTVLDFTMGSGSCGVACKNTNRNFIGFELDENYFKIAKDRIEGK